MGRADLGTATDLRRMAKQQGGRHTTLRLLAIANALDGMSRAQAARSAGIERPSVCDAIQRFNAEGIAGLIDRPKGHRSQRLSEAEQAVLINRILRGPAPDQGEPCAWTLPDLCRFIEERFDKSMGPQSMSRVVRRLGLSRQKARPVHPQKKPKAAAASDHAPLVDERPAPARRLRQALRVGLHLRGGAALNGGGLRARAAQGLLGCDERLPGRLCRDRPD
jgi:transposase